MGILRKILPICFFSLLVLLIQPVLLRVQFFGLEQKNNLAGVFLITASAMGVLACYYKMLSVDAFITERKLVNKEKPYNAGLFIDFTKYMHAVFIMVPALFGVMILANGNDNDWLFLLGMVLVIVMFLADLIVSFNFGVGESVQFHYFWRDLIGDLMAVVYVFTVHTLIFGQFAVGSELVKSWEFALVCLIVALFWGCIMWALRLPDFIEGYFAEKNIRHPFALAIKQTLLFFAVGILVPIARSLLV